jgi:uncharacterized protein YqhQ
MNNYINVLKFKNKMSKLKIGGQAVINGVMMRSPNYYSVSVRKENNKIKTIHKNIPKPKKIFKVPFIRGIYNLIDMMKVGLKALNFSAEEASDEEEKLKPYQLILTTIITFAIAIFIFKYLPLLSARFFENSFTLVKDNYILFNIIDGLSKIVLFALYIFLISRLKEIKEVFRYHGAEHKTVNCYEANKKLTPKNCMKFSRLNLRCGTSFIVIVLIISIFVYVFIPKEFSFLTKLGLRVLLLPAIASVSYEILKLLDKFKCSKFARFLSAPGLLIQRLTCYEPNEKQIEVAIKSIKEVIKLEN